MLSVHLSNQGKASLGGAAIRKCCCCSLTCFPHDTVRDLKAIDRKVMYQNVKIMLIGGKYCRLKIKFVYFCITKLINI